MCSTASIVAGQRCLTVIDMAKQPTLNPDSPVPLYVQAADYLTARITSGDLPVGARLPAERDLAEQWGIAYQTVRRTMRELRDRGLVASVVGKGTFVTSETPRQP
jgi:GntR family transcriptional regulator